METLNNSSLNLISHINSLNYTRSLSGQIQWTDKLIEIKGGRGTGKTTLMLQRASWLHNNKYKVIYVSLEDPYFYQNTLLELADQFQKYGGTHLFVDEVHRYPFQNTIHDWSKEIKNIYDKFPVLNVIYSSSSLLQLYQGVGDLSRRKASYTLNGLSFREFLFFENGVSFQPFSLQDILKGHVEIASEITSRFKVLPFFKKYLSTGYFPFYKENEILYHSRLRDVITTILEVDIPAVAQIPYEATLKIKKLLSVIATSVPYTPQLKKMGDLLGIGDQRTLLKYLNFMEKAELISTLSKEGLGNQIIRKPDKIYLHNTNLMSALAPDISDTGNIRETFFYNQLKTLHKITYPESGDFLVDGKYLFEIGGKSKKSQQIREMENAFLVGDELETGWSNKIPLWLFGMLY